MAFGFTLGKSQAQTAHDPGRDLSILILSDFSGRSNRGVFEPLSTRKHLPVTIDNQETVFTSFEAALDLPPGVAGEPGFRVHLQTLEDFHPDQLVSRLAPLTSLFEAMTNLRNPGKTSDAEERLRRLLTPSTQSSPADELSARVQRTQESPESDKETLTRLLGQTNPEAGSPKKTGALSPVEGLIRRALEASNAVAPSVPAGIEGLSTAAEMELSSRLRSVLHDRHFQALEATWRGVDFLLRRCPDEERIRFFVLDVSLDELAADIEGLQHLLRDAPPQLILGNYFFGQTNTDLGTLGRIADLCSELGARFVGGAHSLLIGCESFARHPDPDEWNQPVPSGVTDQWAALRALPHSECIGLALPRFLLRQPYGQGSDPIEGFAFEEIPHAADHEAFLWGNPALLCAQLLAESFAVRAESVDVDEGGEVDGLPVFHYKEDGESVMKPCAEAWLVDRAAASILRQGLIPALSIKGRDAVRLVTLCSISNK